MSKLSILAFAAGLGLAAPALAGNVLHGFAASPDTLPNGPVAVAPDGSFYGTMYYGYSDYGSVYRIAYAGPGEPWSFQTIYNFVGGTDGSGPGYRLAIGADGSVYGVTVSGGYIHAGVCPAGCGTLYRLSPPPAGQTQWVKTIIDAFDLGGSPSSGVLIGPSGELYGTLSEHPGSGGVAYQELPPASGQTAWTRAVLHKFHLNSEMGSNPAGELMFNKQGFLVGTTEFGGTIIPTDEYCGLGCGAVYALHPPTAGDPEWRLHRLYALQPSDGYNTKLGVVEDRAGALYTISQSEAGGHYNLLRLQPPGTAGDSWSASTIHSFPASPADGLVPNALAAAGDNIFGTTLAGGMKGHGINHCGDGDSLPNCGTFFELSPPASGVGAWSETIVMTQTKHTGTAPIAMTRGANRLFYMTNARGGPGATNGTVERLRVPQQ